MDPMKPLTSISVTPYQGDRLSLYRTRHTAENFATLESEGQLPALRRLKQAHPRKKFFIIGNGSNLAFRSSRIQSFVIKNNLPEKIEQIDDIRYRIGGSTMINKVLKHCLKDGRDSFYYLASVPGTIGGALAMNAGRGRSQNQTIYDFVEAVRWYCFESGEFKESSVGEVKSGYRSTLFSGASPGVILDAVFSFDRKDFSGVNPIEQRKLFSRETQDHSAPNCGSVFKSFDMRLMNKVRAEGLECGSSRFSKKTINWILNEDSAPDNILKLIRRIEWMHRIRFKKIEREVVVIE
jgi:UDP-N-acetylmuramate dehydrogenase